METQGSQVFLTDKAVRPQWHRPCLICRVTDFSVVFPSCLPRSEKDSSPDALHYQYHSSNHANLWHYQVVQCRSCGHKYPNPIYDQKTVESSYLLQEHDNEFGIDLDLLRRTNSAYVDVVNEYWPQQTKRNCHLDVGCDTGIFLKEASRLGFSRRVGVEPGRDSSEKARTVSGVEIMQKIFDPKDFQAESVDLVSLVHVLDHLVDSRRLLKEIRPCLVEGGVVFAVVHNIDSFVAKISGQSWAPLNLLHMEYFQPQTLKNLFEAEGYQVKAVVGTKNYFPLHHLIRFAPFLPSPLRRLALKVAMMPFFRSLVLGLKLGNIGIIATK